MNNILLIYLVVANTIAFTMYGIDKQRAIKEKWRISEKTLLLIGAIGGSVGAFLGMQMFNHKTKHWQFKILVPLFMVLHIVFVVAFIILN
jgi:uncharacterized membrane protein YsdA (DUF1294 family)